MPSVSKLNHPEIEVCDMREVECLCYNCTADCREIQRKGCLNEGGCDIVSCPNYEPVKEMPQAQIVILNPNAVAKVTVVSKDE